MCRSARSWHRPRKRLPAEQGLPIVRSLLARTEDLDDLQIPLLLWWSLEDKTISDRQAVLDLFADEATWHLPIVDQHILGRVMQRYAMEGKPSDLNTCAQLLELAPRPAPTGAADGWADGRLSGGGQSVVSRPRWQKVSIVTGSHWVNPIWRCRCDLGDEKAIDQALKMVADEEVDASTRLAYIEILGQIDVPRSVPVLLKLLSRPGGYVIKRAALQH